MEAILWLVKKRCKLRIVQCSTYITRSFANGMLFDLFYLSRIFAFIAFEADLEGPEEIR